MDSNINNISMPNIGNKEKTSLQKIIFGLLSDDFNKRSLLENEGLLLKYGKYLIEIWKPEPSKPEDREKKDIVLDAFPQLYSIWANSRTIQQTFQTDLNDHLLKIYQKFADAKKKMKNEWHIKANPFLTVMIEDSYKNDIIFQEGAKIASSVETSWGEWVEGIFTFYNPKIKYINAAGMDYVYNGTAYDVKSGPQVMNKDQVAQAASKRHRIHEMSTDPDFKGVIGVNEFNVAIVYGNKNIANSFMKRAEDGLIIYGNDTWSKLTGDERNAFDFFIRCIEFMVQNGAEWSKSDLESATVFFNDIFYGSDQQKLRLLKSQSVYTKLFSQLSN